ncbi:MAG: Translation initiation factor IF-1 [Candidatus Woesebacteria bacterium GW2011_GWA1_37_8]|uniref:Translation initiation factor IF-1 n=2 Tax=Candidatus Woeseibacteriota TaxID=1752722 RepID=A0A0G0LIF1_9BACT|nr:MAG: Translation initiation factor IF-1 [Microgenomates group bacterium GW2011_GWC1_37_12b]KKQ45863.1 MAG: Translation initiation factor IF-1 [Candidatus Woesebacteria bacterium GW2011_GWA1_37_8]KKQ87695.1 MAG: Translation initiation factor IF-1 [Candidatus Woesebacteria bacterium GW2011_GWB1_38_8b]
MSSQIMSVQIMNNQVDIVKINAKVLESLPNTMFRVELEGGRVILTSLKGTLRRRYVRIFPGDTVVVEMTKYDEDRGRIVAKIGR